jgi:hypothetical protein
MLSHCFFFLLFELRVHFRHAQQPRAPAVAAAAGMAPGASAAAGRFSDVGGASMCAEADVHGSTSTIRQRPRGAFNVVG